MIPDFVSRQSIWARSCLAVAVGWALCGTHCVLAEDDPPKPAKAKWSPFGRTAQDDMKITLPNAGSRMVKLGYLQATWKKVLDDLADATGTTVVADKYPTRTFSRWDRREHTVDEAIKILNKELEPLGYRILLKKEHLLLIDVPSSRPEYPRPVVTAPFGLTLGGGAEISLHSARRQPHAETYMGLVEAGVGLIPGGGGTKEMFLRALDAAVALNPPDPRDPPSRYAQGAEMGSGLKRSFETIAMAKASTSAAEARGLGLLAASDRITLNRERLLLDAKAQVIALAESGYTAPQPRTQMPAPGTAGLALMETGALLMGEAGFASEHDRKVARWVAYILAGGRITPGTPVSEQYLLDLEREAFLSLCGEPKTQERIAFTLKTGKPLRN